MLNPDETIVSKLNEIGLKVIHINSIDLESDVPPCITWYQYDNHTYTEANNIGYSTVIYKIRIWAIDLAVMNSYAAQIDSKMRSLGFERTGVIEEWRTNLGYKEFKYENLYLEDF